MGEIKQNEQSEKKLFRIGTKHNIQRIQELRRNFDCRKYFILKNLSIKTHENNH